MTRTVVILALLTCAVQPRAALAQEDWDVVADEDSAATAPEPVAAPATTAQDDEDFSLLGGDYLSFKGYFENQLGVFKVPRKRTAPESSGWEVMDYNRLRVDLSARPVRGFKVDTNVIARTFHGTTRFDLRDMLPRKFDGDLDLLVSVDPSLVQFELGNEIFVDNAYFTADAGSFRLRVGKQQMRFGSGYSWNPTDPFNAKDLLDPTYEVTGITAVRMQLFLPHEGLLEAYVLPYKRLEEFHAEDMSAALRARVALDRWVAAATYAYFPDLVGIDRTTAMPLDARRSLFGLELTGEIGGIGVWGEGAFNLTDRKRRSPRLEPFGNPTCADGLGQLCWFEALVGANYTFEGGVVVQAEYLYNGRGYTDSGQYMLSDWYAYMEQTVRYLGAHYVTGMVQIPIAEIHVSLTAMAIANLSDGSMLFTPWVQWDWSQYLALTLYGALNYSDDATDEFRTVGHAGYLRFRFSF